jgi:hypothetical protein
MYGALILKIHIDQELAQSLIARKLPNGRALLQAGSARGYRQIFARKVR